MAILDIRAPIDLSNISEILLQVAENPLDFVKHFKHTIAIPGDEVGVAAQLARQASATIVSNCVVDIWSTTVHCLHALEPDFPLYPSNVPKFVKEVKLPFLSYMSLYYSLCRKPFNLSLIHI